MKNALVLTGLANFRVVTHSETLCRSLFTSCELYTSLLAN